MYSAAHTVLSLTLVFYFLQSALKGHVLTVHLLVSDGNVLMKCNYHNQFAFFAIQFYFLSQVFAVTVGGAAISYFVV